jgi:hypothetical protein
MILTLRDLAGIGREIRAGDMVMPAALTKQG